MNFLKNLIKKKILNTYDNLSAEYLHKLKVIQKDLLNIKICNDNNLDLTIKGLLYNFLILPHFSKFFIFFYSFKIPMIFPLSSTTGIDSPTKSLHFWIVSDKSSS